jgi:PAS domain S-box-containing protein
MCPPPSTQLDSLPLPWLRTLVANVQDAIVVLDSSGRVVFESASASDMLGRSESEFGSGAFGLERIHPDERQVVMQSFERTIAVPGPARRW